MAAARSLDQMSFSYEGADGRTHTVTTVRRIIEITGRPIPETDDELVARHNAAVALMQFRFPPA